MPIWLIQILVGLALSAAKSLIDMATKKDEPQPGVRGSVTTGGDVPLSFIMGRYGTPGHREYAGSWGAAGNTPNAYYVDVLSVSDLPVTDAVVELWVNSEPATVEWGATPTDQGYPVTEYRVDGKDHLWVRKYDGTQTTANSYLLAKFGSHPERPWLSDMIGRGIAYVVVTALVNRELFPGGFPQYFFVVDGIANYDRRSGLTAKSDNAVVLAENVLRGIFYDGEWVFGLQGLPASRLPVSNWPDQMDKADTAIPLAGGGTEPQYRAGAEISVDQQPRDVVLEFLNSANGRIAEIGGTYKVLVGAPEAPVYSFTDEDVIISEGQSFEPFPGLENTHNGVSYTHIWPDKKWVTDNGPPLYYADLEAEDDDRRLVADVSFPMVYSDTQAQRLAKAMLEEARRFRTHSHTMPPEFWEYEPLDAVYWTSDRNGYENKVFLITAIEDLPNGNQVAAFKEQDPTDYDWDPDEDEQEVSIPSLVIVRPSSQSFLNFDVLPSWFADAGAVVRIPAIEATWDAGLDDVRAVALEVRLNGLTLPFISIEVPYETASGDPGYIISEGILPERAYQVRAKPLPYGGRATDWTGWDNVTTVDTKVPGGKLDGLSVETGAVALNAFTDITTFNQVSPVGPNGQTVVSGTVPVSDPDITGVLIQFTAFMRRPAADPANFGDWSLKLLRNGVEIEETPPLFYDDNFAYPTPATFFDLTPGVDPDYEIDTDLASGPGNFTIEGGKAVCTLFKR